MTTTSRTAPCAAFSPRTTSHAAPQQIKAQETALQDTRSPELAAYEYLNNVLNAAWTTPLEIEILPPALQEDQLVVRVIETSVGIPNELLILAFQYARNLFFYGLPQAREQGLQPWDDMQVCSQMSSAWHGCIV